MLYGGGGTMVYNAKEKARTMAYAREHIKRVPLDMSKADYERLKQAAMQSGMKVNTFIKTAINAKIDALDDGKGNTSE